MFDTRHRSHTTVDDFIHENVLRLLRETSPLSSLVLLLFFLFSLSLSRPKKSETVAPLFSPPKIVRYDSAVVFQFPEQQLVVRQKICNLE
jgi:hypothetical protein